MKEIDTVNLPDDIRLSGHDYTLGEQRAMIRKMEEASRVFYGMAVQIGVHAFIEHCGLMNKYIDICREAMNRGVPFYFANTHNEEALPMESHHAAYLAEKLDCIYGPAFRANPEWAKILAMTLSGDARAQDGLGRPLLDGEQ